MIDYDTMECRECNFTNPENARFCSNCGTALRQRCPNCQVENAAGVRYCMYCGHNLRTNTPLDENRHTRLAAAVPARLMEKVRSAAHLAGERRTVTVVFMDIVNYSQLVQQIGDEAGRTLTTEVFDRLAPVIYRYEGTVARLIGDSMIAFFGAPVAHEDDPVRAAWAALECIQKANHLAEDIRRQYNIQFSIRACLNTGPVVIGALGEDLRYTYTDPSGLVNLAVRLKFVSQPGQVLLSENTHRFISGLFETTELGTIEVTVPTHAQVPAPKNEQGPVRVFALVKPRNQVTEAPEQQRFRSPLVGRETELTTLLQLTRTVQAGLGRAVLIVGDPGLGKTRLLREWKARLLIKETRWAESPSLGLSPEPGPSNGFAAAVQWYEGHCYSYIQERAYQLLNDLLRNILGVSIIAPEHEVRQGLLSLCKRLFGEQYTETYASLAHLMLVKLDEVQQTTLQSLSVDDPQALQNQYALSLQRLLVGLAGLSPLVIVLENIHWADPASATLLSRLFSLVYNEPILFCMAARPVRESTGWRLAETARETLGSSLTMLTLSTLKPEDNLKLVHHLLGSETAPESIRQSILRHAEGNPLYTEEIIRMFVDQEVIREKNGKWISGTANRLVRIPDNLQGLLQARIDRLPEDVKYTLKVASVIGRRFTVRVVARIMGMENDRAALIRNLNALEAAGLLRVFEVEPELMYIHQHILVREAAYTSILDEDRRRLHAITGEILEETYQNRLQDVAPRLAGHFREGGDVVRACKYYRMAGETAMASFANIEAEGYFRSGLALANAEPNNLENRATLLIALGRALSRQSNYEEAIQHWLQAIELYKQLGDLDNMARQYAHVARNASHLNDYPLCLRYCQEGLQAVNSLTESHGLAALLHETARAYHFNGYPKEARELCEKSLEMAGRLNAVDIQADALATYGILPNLEPEQALASLEKAVELAESAGLLRIAARAHHNLGAMLRSIQNDQMNPSPDIAQTARLHFLRTAELNRQRGAVAEELLSMASVADIALASGDLKEVEQLLPQLRKLSQAIDHSSSENTPPLSQASSRKSAGLQVDVIESQLLSLKGQWYEALRLKRACRMEARRRGDLQTLAAVNTGLGLTLLELSHWEKLEAWDEAENALREAIRIGKLGLGSLRSTEYLLALVQAARGSLDEASQITNGQANHMGQVIIGSKAIATGPKANAPVTEAMRLWASANIALKQQRWKEASDLYEASASIYLLAGMRWFWARVLLDWSQMYITHTLFIPNAPTTLPKAQELLQQAQRAFAEIGAQHYMGLATRLLEELSAETIAQALAYQQDSQELAAAGRIQETLLPSEAPILPGWQFAVDLHPARVTSGDFYDFIPLSGNRLGIVIADVADKGAGAALFMALTRTLIRTYAIEYPDSPERVLSAASRRILSDTNSSLFVTMFYGILDPQRGSLMYCNAGHNPPYLYRTAQLQPEPLVRTGVPLGLFEEATWEKANVQFNPGDLLVLYSDGIPDALNEQNILFGEDRLQGAIRKLRTQSSPTGQFAQAILNGILNALHAFAGPIPFNDDTTLMVMYRDPIS